MRSTRQILLCATWAFALAAAANLAFAQADTGTYTAKMGSTAAVGSVGVSGTGGAAAGGKTTKTEGTAVTIKIDGWATPEQMKELIAAQTDAASLMAALKKLNFGSVQIAGINKTFPVNLAFTAKRGSKNVAWLVSAQTFSKAGPSGQTSASGITVGLIELALDANGAGTGNLFTETQIFIETKAVMAKAGATTATPLTGVARS